MTARFPQVADLFYSGNSHQLGMQVDGLLADAERELTAAGGCAACAPMALLPHAGYVYCGAVIARTLVRMRLPERLILLCPNHTGKGGPLAVWPEGVWHTPLGMVEVDAELADALLAAQGGYEGDVQAHAQEHAIEVLLPFIQRCAPTARIVPIVVAANLADPAAPARLRRAGEALAGVIRAATAHTDPAGGGVSVLISSDMHHFGDEPTTLHLDELALRCLLQLDPEGLWNTVARERISMCGVAPATLALWAARAIGVERAELVAHTTSAEVSGDAARVVGYAGAVLWASPSAFGLSRFEGRQEAGKGESERAALTGP